MESVPATWDADMSARHGMQWTAAWFRCASATVQEEDGDGHIISVNQK